MPDKSVNVSVPGLGLFGWLIVLGILGLGPCTDCMKGCGPTISIPKLVQPHQAERP